MAPFPYSTISVPSNRPRNVTKSVTKLLNVNLRPVPASADRLAEFFAFPCHGHLCYNPIIAGNVPKHSANSGTAVIGDIVVMTIAQVELSLALTRSTGHRQLRRLAQAHGVTDAAVVEQALALLFNEMTVRCASWLWVTSMQEDWEAMPDDWIAGGTRCPHRRGDIIAVPYEYSDLTGGKVRPALILSSDAYNLARPDVVAAEITSQMANVGPYDHVLADWATAGLRYPSLVLRRLLTMSKRSFTVPWDG